MIVLVVIIVTIRADSYKVFIMCQVKKDVGVPPSLLGSLFRVSVFRGLSLGNQSQFFLSVQKMTGNLHFPLRCHQHMTDQQGPVLWLWLGQR